MDRDGQQLPEKLKDLYMDILIERVTSVRYPSKEILDRIENLAHSQGHAKKMVCYLIERVEASRYPSHQLLDRLERILYGTPGRPR